MFSISAVHESTLLAGIIGWVSSAILQSRLPQVTAFKSQALTNITTYAAGPMAEPWMMLVTMVFSVDI
jgi:hypothetical protein